MGLFKKIFGGDEGIRESMYETCNKVKSRSPTLKPHEVSALVLHYRYKAIPIEIVMIIGVIFPEIEALTKWVIGLENSGFQRANWPNPKFVEYMKNTTADEERNKAFAYMQDPKNMSDIVRRML